MKAKVWVAKCALVFAVRFSALSIVIFDYLMIVNLITSFLIVIK